MSNVLPGVQGEYCNDAAQNAVAHAATSQGPRARSARATCPLSRPAVLGTKGPRQCSLAHLLRCLEEQEKIVRIENPSRLKRSHVQDYCRRPTHPPPNRLATHIDGRCRKSDRHGLMGGLQISSDSSESQPEINQLLYSTYLALSIKEVESCGRASTAVLSMTPETCPRPYGMVVVATCSPRCGTKGRGIDDAAAARPRQ